MKLREYGDRFLGLLDEYCGAHELSRDNAAAPERVAPSRPAAAPNLVRTLAYKLFRERSVIEDVMHQTGRARATVCDYLCQFIREERPGSIETWVNAETYSRVSAAVKQVGVERLKPIYLALGERVSYDEIRLVLAHLAAMG